jgi:alanyl-tRNA synthetase
MPYADKEKQKAAVKAWCERNIEKRRIADREFKRKERKVNPEKYREAVRLYTKRHPELIAATVRKYKKSNPEKVSAHRAVECAVKNGSLVKKACSICGNERSQAHHEDYTKQLDVIWLCQKHHSELHLKRRIL